MKWPLNKMKFPSTAFWSFLRSTWPTLVLAYLGRHLENAGEFLKGVWFCLFSKGSECDAPSPHRIPFQSRTSCRAYIRILATVLPHRSDRNGRLYLSARASLSRTLTSNFPLGFLHPLAQPVPYTRRPAASSRSLPQA